MRRSCGHRGKVNRHLPPGGGVGVELVMTSGLKTIETNLRETQYILDAASASRTPILIASTSEVYGKSEKAAFSEEDDLLIGPPHLSRWSYACSKLMMNFWHWLMPGNTTRRLSSPAF